MPVLLPYSQTPAASCELALAAAARCEAGCGVKLQGSQPAKTPWPAPSPSPASTCLIRIFLTCKMMARAGPVKKGREESSWNERRGMNARSAFWHRSRTVLHAYTHTPHFSTSQQHNNNNHNTTTRTFEYIFCLPVASYAGTVPRTSASACTCKRANGRGTGDSVYGSSEKALTCACVCACA